MRPFDIGDDPRNVAGAAFAVALGRAFNKGRISEDAMREFFTDYEDALRRIDSGEPLTEELPNFVGNIIDALGFGVTTPNPLESASEPQSR